MQLVNLVKVTTATVGTGTMTLGSAVSGFLTPALAGAVTGATYSYGITDGTNSEAGYGVWTSGTNTLTRTVLASTNSNAAISLSGTAKVYFTPTSRDFDNIVTDSITLGGPPDNTIYSTTLPTAPTEGSVLYSAKRANRRMLEWMTPTGRNERVGPWLGDNNTLLVQATWNATTLTSMGLTFSAITGTVTGQTYATTNYLTMQRRVQATSSATTTMPAFEGVTGICSRAPGNGGGGFHAAWRFGIVALPTDAKFFCGFASTALFANVNPNTLFNIIGLGKISTNTTTLALYANGSSGTAQAITLTNTGSMTNIANTFWQVEIFCKTGDTQFGYRVTRISSAGVEAVDEGVTTGTQGGAAGIPADATVFAPHLWCGPTTAVAHTIQFCQFFLDSD
jgi:hypothetical protein